MKYQQGWCQIVEFTASNTWCNDLKFGLKDFPGVPVVVNLPYNTGHAVQSQVRAMRSHMPVEHRNSHAAATDVCVRWTPAPQPECLPRRKALCDAGEILPAQLGPDMAKRANA